VKSFHYQSKATLGFSNKTKKPEGGNARALEKQSRSNFHYADSNELDPAGQFLTSLDSSGTVCVLLCFIKLILRNRYKMKELVLSHTFYFQGTNLMLARTLTEKFVYLFVCLLSYNPKILTSPSARGSK